jgi:hypothetical protein
LGSPADPAAGYDALRAQYGRVRVPIGCFLLPGKINTLIDTGVGTQDLGRGMLVGGNLINHMRRQSFHPDDIDSVYAISDHHERALLFGDAMYCPASSRT